jgi:RNA polymerase sigma-70 factor, ECF subfamily
VVAVPDDGQVKGIIEQCQMGDRRAQRALFHLYREHVMRLVSRMLAGHDPHDIQDTIQLVYIAVFRSLPLFRGDSSFDTWVYRICMKTCVNQLRTKYRKRRLFVDGDGSETVEHARDEVAETDELVLRRETAGKIRQALAKLDVDRRAVLILYEMESRSLEEIARTVNKPVGTVKSRLFRARQDMCRYLREYVTEEGKPVGTHGQTQRAGRERSGPEASRAPQADA